MPSADITINANSYFRYHYYDNFFNSQPATNKTHESHYAIASMAVLSWDASRIVSRKAFYNLNINVLPFLVNFENTVKLTSTSSSITRGADQPNSTFVFSLYWCQLLSLLTAALFMITEAHNLHVDALT